MRPPPGPIYRSGSARYGIDRCEPQLQAIAQGKIKFHALAKQHYPGQPLGRALPGLNSLGFWDAAGPQDWGLDAHRNEGIEMAWLETGSSVFAVDRQRFELRPGSLTLTRPWQLHKLGAPHIGPGRLHWLILDVGVRRPNQDWRWPPWVMLTRPDLAALTRKLRLSDQPVWTATPEIAHSFRGLAESVLHWERPYAVSRLTTRLNQLLVALLDLLTAQPAEEKPELTSRRHTVELFLRDLAENPASSSADWTIERMARHCGLGVTALSKYCRELVNSGPVEYLNLCRLNRAARQLRQELSRPITEIAFANGFNSSQYFATVFRRQFHTTPRAYREGSAAAKSGRPHGDRGGDSLSPQSPRL